VAGKAEHGCLPVPAPVPRDFRPDQNAVACSIAVKPSGLEPERR
jgi:hypothetical protein